MAGAVRLPVRMSCGLEALAKVIAASAVVDQAKIPRTDGQFTFSFVLQEGDQLCDEIREDIADEGVVLLHERSMRFPSGSW
ncbi:hypothetical protein Scel_81860 [Streptomyces cellostaticus]|nr:hypothetical protein Scel_81860 [Streptomyces cellostaticus]